MLSLHFRVDLGVARPQPGISKRRRSVPPSVLYATENARLPTPYEWRRQHELPLFWKPLLRLIRLSAKENQALRRYLCSGPQPMQFSKRSRDVGNHGTDLSAQRRIGDYRYDRNCRHYQRVFRHALPLLLAEMRVHAKNCAHLCAPVP